MREHAARLTSRGIKSFAYRGGWDVRWDAVVTGLGLRVYPAGANRQHKKAFVLSYRFKGKKRLMALGQFGRDMTVEQARATAIKRLAEIRNGVDPLVERQRTRRGETFGDLIDVYLEEHAKRHKKTWRTDEGRLGRHVPAPWRGRKVAAITREDVRVVHAAIGRTRPYEANRFLDLLHVMFRLARLWYMVEPGAENPAEGVKKFQERKRKRFARPDEMPQLAAAIDREASVYVRAAVWLYLLTGARKSELLNARHSDIDWGLGRLRLRDTKAAEEQYIPLSAPALAILQSIPRMERNEFILCGAKEGRPLVNIDKPWRRIRNQATLRAWAESDDARVAGLFRRLEADVGHEPSAAACREAAKAEHLELPVGVTDIRLHDLRRTVGSWLSASGTDLNMIREALRHQHISTTLTYARLGRDAAKDAMEEHGKRMMAAAGRRGPVGVGKA
ncbi:MAG: tyrosine-type recombinase/integrase [Alphaproteobacteria bacterium]